MIAGSPAIWSAAIHWDISSRNASLCANFGLTSGSGSSPPAPDTNNGSGWGEQRFGSPHLAGANFVFVDGSVKMISYTISQNTFWKLGVRNDGQPIGAGLTTRVINRRLRRALEHRHRTCAVPDAAPPAACTPITSATGKTAA